MSRRTFRGKARRSFRLEPTHATGRSVVIIHEYVYTYVMSRNTRDLGLCASQIGPCCLSLGQVAILNVALFGSGVRKSRMRSAEGDPAQASLDGAPPWVK